MNAVDRNRKIAITAALSALTVLFGMTRLGLIPWFSGASITILHIPVILGTLLEGVWVGTGVGAVFGILSLIMAATSGTGLDVYFTNPLISVLPRLLIAPSVYFVALGLRSLSARAKFFPPILADAVSAFVGAMANSVFVLGALVIARAITFPVMLTVLAGNSLLEAAAAVVICVAVIAVRSALQGAGKKSKLADEE